MTERIITEAASVESYVIQARRTIHIFAEIGGEEYKTSAYIKTELAALGLPVETVGDTGLLATLDTGRPGPGVALRADIDALPIRENPNNLAGPRVCVSENEDTCHACGHDAHAAMLLGAARVLCCLRDELCGVVYFCFEAGEENGRGVRPMLDALKSRTVDVAWAMHVSASFETGRLSVQSGPRMAGGSPLNIKVAGRGGHVSRPDLSVNPVFTAAAIVTSIPGALITQLHPMSAVTFGVTHIKSSGADNAFPDTAEITGSMRFYDFEQGNKALGIVKRVAENTAATHDCTVEFGPIMSAALPPVVNDAAYTELARGAIGNALPGVLLDCDPWFGSESFSMYQRRYPGVFAFLGIANPAAGVGADHHNEYFDVDESALKTGVIATASFAAAVVLGA